MLRRFWNALPAVKTTLNVVDIKNWPQKGKKKIIDFIQINNY